MSNNSKGKLQAAPVQPTVAARLTITAFTDRPPTLDCTVDLVGALRLLSAALALVSNVIEQGNLPQKAQADPVDKKREYLGPRK
jgi:hypothetical protein